MFRTLWYKIPLERQRLIIAMAILAGVVTCLDYAGHAAQLYQADYVGYDKVVHFLAGAFCGTFGLWLFHETGILSERLYALSVAFLLSFWVGLGWEAYEVLFGDANLGTLLYWGDTASDMVADTLGGLSAGWLLWRSTD